MSSNRNKFQKFKNIDTNGDPTEEEEESKPLKNQYIENIYNIPLGITISAFIVSMVFLIILFERTHTNIFCSHDLIYGVKIEKEKIDTFSVVSMAAANMEIDRALNGTKMGICRDHCRKSFGIGPYRCTNQFCQLCQISIPLEKDQSYYSLCIHACGCCATNSCNEKCSVFVKDHACNFDCSKFGYSHTPCV